MTGHLHDVLPAAAALLGVPAGTDRLGLRERLGAVPRVAVVLVDGMGTDLLDVLAPHAPLLADALAGPHRPEELHCGFPATTPVSLVSLGTGVRSGAHGVLGFTTVVPGSDRTLTHIAWRDDPAPTSWQPEPTWFERIRAAGLEARAVLPAPFVGSGLTEAAYRGATFCPLGRDEDPAQRLLRELGTGPGLVYGYTSVLDTAAHLHGIGSPQWFAAASEVDAYLTRVVEGLPAEAVLLVTADHGGLNAGPDDRIDLAADPTLAAGLRAVAGDPRVRYLHVRDGATDDVHAAWTSVLGDRADVLTRDEAVAADLFGPVRTAHLDRLGDLVVICRGTTVVLASGYEPAEVSSLVGFHGASTHAETAVPLFVLSGRR